MLSAPTVTRRVVVVAMVAAALVLYRVWFVPLAGKWQDVSQATRAARTRLQKSQNLIAMSREIREQWKDTSKEIADAEEAMSFQSYLTSVEQSARVTEKSRKALSVTKLRGRTVESFSLSLSGDLMSVLNFLGKLQDSPRLLRVTKATIRSKENSDSLEADLEMSTFLAGEPVGKGK